MLVNCTPHSLTILDEDGQKVYILPPSGTVARVAVTRTQAFTLHGVPVYRAVTGPLVDVPDPAPDVYYVCSLVAAQAAWAAGRDDVLAPGELIRNAEGQPIGSLGLNTAPA